MSIEYGTHKTVKDRSGLGFQVKVMKAFQVVPSSLEGEGDDKTGFVPVYTVCFCLVPVPVPLSSAFGTYETCKARLWSWISGRSPQDPFRYVSSLGSGLQFRSTRSVCGLVLGPLCEVWFGLIANSVYEVCFRFGSLLIYEFVFGLVSVPGIRSLHSGFSVSVKEHDP